MLGPQHVGQRVVVRRIAGMRDDRPVYSDILGHLLEATETHLTVRTRTGPIRVPATEIIRARPVPPRRRFTPTEALEAAAALGWPPAERASLGDWQLRATGGWTQRANSALAIGDPDVPTSEAIEFIQRWYRDRDLTPAISLPVPLFQRLDDELERRGWTAMPTTQVMTARLTELTFPQFPARPGRLALATAPSPEWLAAVGGRKGRLPDAAAGVLTSVPHVRFAEWYGHDSDLLATARGCVADPGSHWLGLSLIGVEEPARRQGLAQRLIAALVEWARTLGAEEAYLQVEQRNRAAVTLYERLGFTVHHVYSSRRLVS